jgi:hypothetical protein
MLTTIAAIAGLVFGFTAFILSILNFRRDRPRLIVALQWDAVAVKDKHGTLAKFGRIYITNSGRRPIYITSAGIEVATRRPYGSIRSTTQGKPKGRKLAEGDPPLSLIVDADGSTIDLLMSWRDWWQDVRAYAIDSSGKKYVSPRVKKRPSWGIGDGRVPRGINGPSHTIECDLEQEQLETYITSGDFLLVRNSEVRRLREQARKAGANESEFASLVEEAKHRVIVITPADHPPDP